MKVSEIPLITVSYNTPELVERLVASFRKYYSNSIHIVDGSNTEKYDDLHQACAKFKNLTIHHFDYNIHHGPGMAWALNNLQLNEQVLILDSDIEIVKNGFLESLQQSLRPEHYGVGYLNVVDEAGFELKDGSQGITYLHPACMLCNLSVLKQWPLPTRHGAPLFRPMKALHDTDQSHLVIEVPWVRDDLQSKDPPNYIRHLWKGTVKKNNNSYQLGDWLISAKRRDTLLQALVDNIPAAARVVVEVGENDGLLARKVKKSRPDIHYYCIKNSALTQHQKAVISDETLYIELDNPDRGALESFENADCWILDQCIETVREPARLFKVLRSVIKPAAAVLMVIPHPQNWHALAKSAAGEQDEYAQDAYSAPIIHKPNISKLQSWLGSAGFVITSGFATEVGTKASDEILDNFKHLLEMTNQDPSSIVKNANTEKYVLIARPV